MKLNVCCTLVKENLSKENNPLRNFWSFSKANIYLKRLFSSKVIHKSVFGLANREKSPLITQITLTTGLKNHQTPFEQNFWFFTWDLESGYHYVDIFSGHQKFSGFSWLFSGKVRFFTFRMLPFGLNSACFCFMKLLRPLVKRRRSIDHCFLYLDDGISRLPERVSAFAKIVGSIKRT